ncbi:MAG TPA: hypothetical protein VFP61_10825 [Acidimicrobiales bacterium]|nr:hypothetical protein [Acidimicrobiales bacterium]
MSVEITCPACATVSHFDELQRDAASFCRSCDYPLFWTRAAQLATVGAGDGAGLRRLPGAAGRQAVATLECPSCTEPNLVTAAICIRCGADMRPGPVVAAPEPQPEPTVVIEPEAPAPAPRRAWWPWAVLAVATLAAIVLLVVLLSQ